MFGTTVKFSAARAVSVFLQLVPLQMVYVLTDLKFRGLKPHVWKVGHSGRLTDCRRKAIEQSIRDKHGNDIKIKTAIGLPVFVPVVIETAIHQAFSRFRSDVYQGTSGGTEWFAWHNWIVAYFVFLWGWSCGASEVYCIASAAFFLLMPIPLDLILCVLILGLFQWTVVGLVAAKIVWPLILLLWQGVGLLAGIYF